jgi:hypothetical protein
MYIAHSEGMHMRWPDCTSPQATGEHVRRRLQAFRWAQSSEVTVRVEVARGPRIAVEWVHFPFQHLAFALASFLTDGVDTGQNRSYNVGVADSSPHHCASRSQQQRHLTSSVPTLPVGDDGRAIPS